MQDLIIATGATAAGIVLIGVSTKEASDGLVASGSLKPIDFSADISESVIARFFRNVIFGKLLFCSSICRFALTLLNDIYPVRSADGVS